MSRIDVIVPCHNYGSFLSDCVDSLLTQDRVDVRVLIIDDASSDDTEDVGSRLAARDARVSFLRHATNRGHIATYNEGLALAEGEYTLLLSADDLVAPDSLSRAVGLLDAHPEVGMAYGRHISFDSGHPPPHDRSAGGAGMRILDGLEFLEASCASATTDVATATAVVRTAVQKQIGGYREHLPHSGDMEMWMRFAACGPIGYIDSVQAYRRKHNGNMSFRYIQLEDLRQRGAALESLFRIGGGRMAESERLRLRLIASRSLAEIAFWEATRAFERGDDSLCRRILEFALETDPSIRSWSAWSHLRWKRRIGPAAWRLTGPLVGSIRSRFRRISRHLGRTRGRTGG